MGKRIQTDHERLMKLAKLVFAMRRAQKKVAVCEIYKDPCKIKEAKKTADGYERSVDYTVERILS